MKERPPLQIRVRFHTEAMRYPHFVIPQGATGTIDELRKDFASVKLDTPIAGTEEWNGTVHFTNDELPIGEELASEVEIIQHPKQHPDISIQYGHKISAWDGNIIIGREFFNPLTQDYVYLEAHETAEGTFRVAEWVPDGNNLGEEWDGPIHDVLARIDQYTPPEGFLEMTIPEDAWC